MSSALLARCPTRLSHPSFAACGGRGGGGGTLILRMQSRRVRCGGVFCCSNQASSAWPEFGDDFYELLGIRQDGSFDEIKQAYKKKALKYHPDVSPPNCTEQYRQQFIVLKKAYDTLSDPVTRAIYDRSLGGLHSSLYDRSLGGLHFDEKMEEQLRWRANWEDQLEALERRSVKKRWKGGA